MPLETLTALVVFVFVTSVTPGPNNLMLMASGANFGFRRTVPHMLGISIGHMVMVGLVGLGLGQLFQRWPMVQTGLMAVSIAYLLWLAWKIAHAAPPRKGAGEGTPLTFLQAAAFQWVNPKAWAMGLTAVSVYMPAEGGWAAIAVAVVFSTVNLPSVSLWTVLGQSLRRFLEDPGRLRAFNRVMAVLLIASLLPLL